MEEYSQFLNLIPEDKDWLASDNLLSEEKKLELRLGPPGEFHDCNNSNTHGAKRVFQQTVEASTTEKNWLTNSNEDQCQKLKCFEKTVEKVNSCTPWSCGSVPSSTIKRETRKEKQQSSPSFLRRPLISNKLGGLAEKSSQPCSSTVACSIPANTTGTNCSNKRIELAPVIGWPPVRSFRKNLASSSLSKPSSESADKALKEGNGGKSDSCKNPLFVKINMEGVPIGRKINLNAYSSYEELSFAIDKLFSGLLAAQRDPSASSDGNKMEEENLFTGSLSRSGNYTLVYEDNEGDRMLVGDVPWHMFVVFTVKRLRVLKGSELSTLQFGSSNQETTLLDSTVGIRN